MDSGHFTPQPGEDRPRGARPQGPGVPALVLLLLLTAGLPLLCGIWQLMPAEDETLLASRGLLTLAFLILSGGIGAFACTRRPLWYPVAPLLTIAALAAAGARTALRWQTLLPTILLFGLLPAVLAVVLALGVRGDGWRRTTTIITAAVSVGTLALILALLERALLGEEISLAALLRPIEDAREAMIAAFDAQKEELAALYGADLAALNLEGAVNAAFNLLPALVAVLCLCVGFLAQKVLLFLYRLYGLLDTVAPQARVFALQKVSAIIFAATYVLSLFFATGENVLGLALENVSVILLPGMAVAGLLSLAPQRVGSAVRVGCLPIAVLLLLLFIYPPLAVVLLAFYGAFATWRRPNA